MAEPSDWLLNKPWLFRAASFCTNSWTFILCMVAVLLGLAVTKDTYVDPHLPGIVYKTAFWLAVGATIFLVVAWMLAKFGDWLGRGVIESFRSIKRGELQELVPFFDRVVGGERPSINELKKIFNANNDVFQVLEKVVTQNQRKRSEIVGFCTIVPMNRAAEPLLAAEELNGLRMTTEHIAPTRRQARVLYIGSIGAEGAKPKAAVLNYVLGVIDDAGKHGVRKVYTRPVTKDGLRVAQKYGFEPVMADVHRDELMRLYVLDVDGPKSRKQRRNKPREPAQPA